MSSWGNLGYREGEKEAPLILVLLIMFGAFILLPCVGIYCLFSWIKYENDHPIYYTYETINGQTGEAASCSSYRGMKCKLSDGTIIQVTKYKENRR